MPVPGWTAEHEWDGWIPFEELPWAKDPPRGFLSTANNRPHDDAYPHLIGLDFHTPYRARRIVETLTASERLTVDDMARLQNDTVSLPARNRLEPSGITPFPCVARIATHRLVLRDRQYSHCRHSGV